jgi:hypothetical protein
MLVTFGFISDNVSPTKYGDSDEEGNGRNCEDITSHFEPLGSGELQNKLRVIQPEMLFLRQM